MFIHGAPLTILQAVLHDLLPREAMLDSLYETGNNVASRFRHITISKKYSLKNGTSRLCDKRSSGFALPRSLILAGRHTRHVVHFANVRLDTLPPPEKSWPWMDCQVCWVAGQRQGSGANGRQGAMFSVLWLKLVTDLYVFFQVLMHESN